MEKKPNETGLVYDAQVKNALQAIGLNHPGNAINNDREQQSAISLVNPFQFNLTTSAFDALIEVGKVNILGDHLTETLGESALKLVSGMKIDNPWKENVSTTATYMSRYLKPIPISEETHKNLSRIMGIITDEHDGSRLLKQKVLTLSESIHTAFAGIDFGEIIRNARETAQLEEKIEKYRDNPVFWHNVRLISKELISLPLDYLEQTDELLDYLCEPECDVEKVKEMVGAFDTSSLMEETDNPEHQNYKFKDFIGELYDSHQTTPAYYRTLIPSFFTVIEGTLSEIFKISERGTAQEIKRKMNAVWDLLNAGYLQKESYVNVAFRNQLVFTNAKILFEQLTASSNVSGGGVKINRNLVLHGKSNPVDWTLEDLHLLMNLTHALLFIRRTLQIWLDELSERISHEDGDIKVIHFKEYRVFYKNLSKKTKKTIRKDASKAKEIIEKDLGDDLKAIFFGNNALIMEILQKSDIDELADELVRRV